MKLPRKIKDKMEPVEVRMLDDLAAEGNVIVEGNSTRELMTLDEIEKFTARVEELAKQHLPEFYVHDEKDKQYLIALAVEKVLGDDNPIVLNMPAVNDLARNIGVLPGVPKGSVFKLHKEDVKQPPDFFCTLGAFHTLV